MSIVDTPLGIRNVVAAPAAEGLDSRARRVAIPRRADREQRIERLHDDDQIVRREIAIDELQQRVAHAIGVRAGLHVVFVEEDREQPRGVARRRLPFVGGGQHRHRRGPGGGNRADEAHRFERERRARLAQIEIGGGEVLDRSSARVGRDEIDRHEASGGRR